MGHRNTVFAQLTTFLPRSCFEKQVLSFGGDVRVRRFPCWAQLCSMLHAQTTGSDSLRDLETSFNAHRSCHYHLGLSEVHRSTLADANEKRSWQIYMQLFYALLDKFKEVKPSRPVRIANKIYTWDSTTIDLCLSVFDWARFRQAKGAIKLHVKYDHGHSIPTLFVVTDGKAHDLTVARRYPVDRKSVLLFDRGYTDFAFFHRLGEAGAFFVTRLKSRIRYTVLERREVNGKRGITSDETIPAYGGMGIPKRNIRAVSGASAMSTPKTKRSMCSSLTISGGRPAPSLVCTNAGGRWSCSSNGSNNASR